MQRICWFLLGTVSLLPYAATGAEVSIAPELRIGGAKIKTAELPGGLVLRKELGIVCHESLDGQIVYRAKKGHLYEAHAVITPKGDFLLMSPEGRHYASGHGKVNTMLACRSSDKGKTWQGPTVAFDIDYSQHGFVPLIPRGSTRIYAFGTQPIPSQYSREKGKHENAPIGFRFSDDDGHTWSEVTLIRPENDPGYLGMSVMRMCETDSGAWIIGSHAADWSKKPLTTCQYLLRSEDRGKTWTLLPAPRPDGWFVPGLGRMDEGRPINLGGGKVLLMARTPEGHLWTARSRNDGKTWTAPKPSPLVHPDAPPMLFHLSDGKTLAAFHHNRHNQTQYAGLTARMEGQKDRSEIWVSLSTDGGQTWTSPRFVFANALSPDPKKAAWYNHQCSYMDVIVEGNVLHLFCPHRWARVLHLRLKESDLATLPENKDLAARQ